MEDGYINELTRILSNLVTLPASAGGVWHNVSRIVGEACQPIQSKMLKDTEYGRAITSALPRHGRTAVVEDNSVTTLNLNASLKPGTAIQTRMAMGSVLFQQREDYFSGSKTGVMGQPQSGAADVAASGSSGGTSSSSEGWSSSKASVQTHYPDYQALKHLLKVKEQEDKKEPNQKTGAQLKQELNEEREKTLKLEEEMEKLQRQLDEVMANPQQITNVTVINQV